MSGDVKLSYKREGERYVGLIEHGSKLFEFKDGLTFAEMMMHTNRFLVQSPGADLVIMRGDRTGLMPIKLEPALLVQLRDDPVGYIKANSPAPRVLDLRPERTSKLVANEKYDMPRHAGLRHGLNTLADAFGETLFAKARAGTDKYWRYEHPGTGRWSDLHTIEYWLKSHATEVQPIDDKHGWLLISVELLLASGAPRFYYPREWNKFGSWITKEQLRVKLEQYRKDKVHVDR